MAQEDLCRVKAKSSGLIQELQEQLQAQQAEEEALRDRERLYQAEIKMLRAEAEALREKLKATKTRAREAQAAEFQRMAEYEKRVALLASAEAAVPTVSGAGFAPAPVPLKPG